MVTATSDRIIALYRGGLGPCNVVYSKTVAGNVDRVAFLSETEFGRISASFSISNVISEATWLVDSDGGAQALEPLLVDAIGLAGKALSVITCPAAMCLNIVGRLQLGTVVYSTTPTGHLAKVGFLDQTSNGRIALGFQISDQITEAAWLAQSPGDKRVEDIDLTDIAA